MKPRDEITLPNGNAGTVLHVYQYGYIAEDHVTKDLNMYITKESNIKPKYRHDSIFMSGHYDVDRWLDEHDDIELITITAPLGGYTIFYKEETFQSKIDRLGERVASIYDIDDNIIKSAIDKSDIYDMSNM